MKSRLTILFLFLMMGCLWQVKAQQNCPDLFHDENGNTYHQVFLDFHATEILEIKYATENIPIESELSTDGYSVIIKNYPGDKSVKMVLKDDTGEHKEVTKSRCFIDPVILQL